jgi:hypothetical protein
MAKMCPSRNRRGVQEARDPAGTAKASGKLLQADTILDQKQALLTPGLIALQKPGGCEFKSGLSAWQTFANADSIWCEIVIQARQEDLPMSEQFWLTKAQLKRIEPFSADAWHSARGRLACG